jgi:hypothetical protein
VACGELREWAFPVAVVGGVQAKLDAPCSARVSSRKRQDLYSIGTSEQVCFEVLSISSSLQSAVSDSLHLANLDSRF